MLLGCVACNNGKQEETETDAITNGQIETEAETEPAPRVNKANIKLDGNVADILYSVDRDETLAAATNAFATEYAKAVGKSATPKKAGTYDASKTEILVGNVKFAESKEVYAALKYSEAKACVVGSKLVVAGYNSALVAEVLEELAVKLKAMKDASGNIVLDENFKIEKTYAEPLGALPVLSGAKPAFVDTGDECYMVDFGEVKDDTVFKSYCDSIVKNGFALYAEKNMEGNLYNTYVNDTYVVNAIYTKYNKNLKVLSQPLSETALPTKAEENVYTPIEGQQTTITQLGMYRDDDISETYNGMAYIIQLNDGSFIIVDGGVDTTKEKYEDRLYNLLKKQAPNPDNIVIAAWLISHAHDDHVDIFEYFFEAYADKITVEKFICNLPTDEQVANVWDPEWNRSAIVREQLEAYFPDVPVIKAHPGQEFYIRNAKIDILFTIDVFDYENALSRDKNYFKDKDVDIHSVLRDFNNTSVIYKLTAEGKSMIFLGDYDDKGYTMSKLYTLATLGSTIMQVAHHGFEENSSNALASKIMPKYVFWPVAGLTLTKSNDENAKVIDLTKVSQNQWIVTNCVNKGNGFIAEDNVFVFNMKTCKVDKYDTLADYLAS